MTIASLLDGNEKLKDLSPLSYRGGEKLKDFDAPLKSLNVGMVFGLDKDDSKVDPDGADVVKGLVSIEGAEEGLTTVLNDDRDVGLSREFGNVNGVFVSTCDKVFKECPAVE